MSSARVEQYSTTAQYSTVQRQPSLSRLRAWLIRASGGAIKAQQTKQKWHSINIDIHFGGIVRRGVCATICLWGVHVKSQTLCLMRLFSQYNELLQLTCKVLYYRILRNPARTGKIVASSCPNLLCPLSVSLTFCRLMPCPVFVNTALRQRRCLGRCGARHFDLAE